MKFIITALVGLFITTSSFAQLTPGSYVVGGGVGFGFSKSPNQGYDSQNTTFTVYPGFGKFTSEKYLFEGGVGYGFFSHKADNLLGSSINQSAHSYSARFGVTRFIPIIDRLYLNIGAFLTPVYSSSRTKNTNSSGFQSESERSNISGSVIIAPGLSYFVNKQWMLFAQVGGLNYRVSKFNDSNDLYHDLSFNLSANSYNLGLRYILGNGTK